MTVRWANRLATAAAVAILVLAFGYLRIRNWTPLAGALIVYLTFLWMLWPRRDPVVQILPDGISAAEYNGIMSRLRAAANRLRDYAVDVGSYDSENFREMADLLDSLGGHVRRNPMHLRTARRFFRHSLDRMIGLCADYTELVRRDLPEHRPRLRTLSEQFESFVPALKRVERACLENDLDALEISVEVLNSQMERRV